MAGLFYTEASVAADFTEISKFPEILGELKHVQTVCTRLFSPPTHESLGMRLSYRYERSTAFQCNSVKIVEIAK